MAVVLVLLALILIAGGGAALFSGYEILLGDRGQPMMLAGATILSAGLVLLGIALLARLALRIARELADIRVALSDVRAANLLATARPPRAGAPEERTEPAFTPRLPEPAPEPETTEEGAELVVPEEPVAPPPPRPTPAPPPRPAPAPVLQAVAPAPAPAPVFQPAPPPPAPEPEPDVLLEAPEVVGSYSSGGNHYTMYADGSIIAETPNGRHRFASLDELKEFVSRGGERG